MTDLIQRFIEEYAGKELPLYAMVTTGIIKTPFLKKVGTARVGNIVGIETSPDSLKTTILAFADRVYNGVRSLPLAEINSFQIEGDYVKIDENMFIPNLTYMDLSGKGIVITNIKKGIEQCEMFADVVPESDFDKARLEYFKHSLEELKRKAKVFTV